MHCQPPPTASEPVVTLHCTNSLLPSLFCALVTGLLKRLLQTEHSTVFSTPGHCCCCCCSTRSSSHKALHLFLFWASSYQSSLTPNQLQILLPNISPPSSWAPLRMHLRQPSKQTELWETRVSHPSKKSQPLQMPPYQLVSVYPHCSHTAADVICSLHCCSLVMPNTAWRHL